MWNYETELENSIYGLVLVVELVLHMHSGTGKAVTSRPAFSVLSSGCPRDP